MPTVCGSKEWADEKLDVYFQQLQEVSCPNSNIVRLLERLNEDRVVNGKKTNTGVTCLFTAENLRPLLANNQPLKCKMYGIHDTN